MKASFIMTDSTRSGHRQSPDRRLEFAGEVHELPSKVVGERDLTKTSSDDGKTPSQQAVTEAAELALTPEGRDKLQKIIDRRQSEIQNSSRRSFENIARQAYELNIDEYDNTK